jgi:hypothetical protein
MIFWRGILFLLTIYFSAIGCSGKSKNNMMPELAYCDSATVMFYNTPGNPRFFKMTKVHEKSILSAIAEDVNGKEMSGKESCTTQGKIYYYGKGDEVFVVYFNKDNPCMQLSFIKTAEKYFTKMDKATQKILDHLQKIAKEPVNN